MSLTCGFVAAAIFAGGLWEGMHTLATTKTLTAHGSAERKALSTLSTKSGILDGRHVGRFDPAAFEHGSVGGRRSVSGDVFLALHQLAG